VRLTLPRFRALLERSDPSPAPASEPQPRADDWQAFLESLDLSAARVASSSYSPRELARALYDDLEEMAGSIRTEIRVREDGIGKYGNVGPHAAALRRARAKLDYLESKSDLLHRAAYPSVLNGEPDTRIFCRLDGCRFEFEDSHAYFFSSGLCPRHLAKATGEPLAEPEAAPGELDPLINHVLSRLPGGS
jgi:hypothetical protein